MAPAADDDNDNDRAPSPLPPLGHDISRPSSTSTQSSNALRSLQFQQHQSTSHMSLPGLSALASVASDPSPQLRAYNGGSLNQPPNNTSYTGIAAPTPGLPGNTPPVCQNCTTSTTPLWRRDELGSVLCNACGLFLKLHGRPRPISLKTDVIKSRNRMKSAGQGQKRKSLFDGNGLPPPRSEAGTPPPNLQGNRRVSHRTSGGNSERSRSPVSRGPTPGLQHHPNIAPQHLFDGVSLAEQTFHHSPSLPALPHMRQPSPGSTTSLNDRHLEPPATYEALSQANTTLKTRVNELEVVNDLYKGRVQELENSDRRAQMRQEQLRQALDQYQHRENDLKRRLEGLEREVAELRDLDSPPHAKRPRTSGVSEYPDPPQPPSNL